MKAIKRFLCVCVMMLMIAALLPIQADAATVKLNKKTAAMYVGETTTLKVTGTSKKVTWSTTNKAVATVTSKGKVSAKKAGTATIRAKVSGKTYSCKVTVKNPYLNATKKSIYVGSTFTLKITGTKAKSWKSSNNAVASVANTGKVTAKKAGTATITCVGTNGKSYTCKITVTNPYLNAVEKTLHIGESVNLTITGTQAKAWNSSNVSVAVVSGSGEVTAIEAGTAAITCTGTNGKNYTCNITVQGHDEVTEIKRPTTTEDGYNKTYCTVCGTELSYTAIKAEECSDVLMSGSEFNTFVDNYRNIKKIVFTDEEVQTKFEWMDVSDQQDGSVLAWVDDFTLYVTTIDGKTLYANEDSEGMFSYLRSLEEVKFDNFDISKTKDLSSMFRGCKALTSVDFTNLDTSNVTNMDQMFYGCSSLENLDVSGFDTSNVKSMWRMFEGCSELTSLNVSHFDTAKVEDMSAMFRGCSKLTSLDVSNFNTAKVRDMSAVFSGCSNLASLDVSGFNTSKVKDMNYMFYKCSSLESLDLNNFDVANVGYFDEMFYGCAKLAVIYGTNWTEEVYLCYSCKDMFAGCVLLEGYAEGRFSIGYANSDYGYFTSVDSDEDTPGDITPPGDTDSKDVPLETLADAVKEYGSEYSLMRKTTTTARGESLHPFSGSVDAYCEESIRVELYEMDSVSSTDSFIMVQVIKLNDAKKADDVLKSFENWTDYSTQETKNVKYANGKYVVYLSMTPSMKANGCSLDELIEYIDIAYNVAIL